MRTAIGKALPDRAIAAAAAQVTGADRHFYNWSDYIDFTVLEDFTTETGHSRVKYDTFEFGNDILEDQAPRRRTGYETLVVGRRPLFPRRQIKAGVFQKWTRPSCRNLLPNAWDEIAKRLAAL